MIKQHTSNEKAIEVAKVHKPNTIVIAFSEAVESRRIFEPSVGISYLGTESSHHYGDILFRCYVLGSAKLTVEIAFLNFTCGFCWSVTLIYGGFSCSILPVDIRSLKFFQDMKLLHAV